MNSHVYWWSNSQSETFDLMPFKQNFKITSKYKMRHNEIKVAYIKNASLNTVTQASSDINVDRNFACATFRRDTKQMKIVSNDDEEGERYSDSFLFNWIESMGRRLRAIKWHSLISHGASYYFTDFCQVIPSNYVGPKRTLEVHFSGQSGPGIIVVH